MKKVLFYILLMIPSALHAHTVTILDAWTVDGTYDPSQEDADFAVSAGTDRIVIVCLSGERDGGGPMTVTSVTLGNQALTELFDFTVGSSSAKHNLHYVGYLLEEGIVAMQGDSLRVNYGVPPQAPDDSAKIHYASYENVDQTTPIIDSDNNTNTFASSLQLAGSITAGVNDKILAFNVLGDGNSPGISTSGYTEETESIGPALGHASAAYHRTATTSVTENPTFTSSPAYRMAVSAWVLNASAEVISVATSVSTFQFGTIPSNTWLTPQLSTITNDGTAAEDFDGKISQFAAGGDVWGISTVSNGADIIRAQWSITSNTGPWTDISAYDTDFTIATNVAASNNISFWLRIQTPVSTTSFSEYSSTLTVTAAAF